MKKNKTSDDLNEIYNLTKEFIEYHDRALPLCAAENVISNFANIPLTIGFQERYIMNNTYSFNLEDNFIGCEKLYPFYQKLSEVCERVFGARYSDARPFTGMNCIDMVAKTLCNSGDVVMILDKEHGGHASVKPVLERLGLTVVSAPYIVDDYDLDYDKLNEMTKKNNIKFILLAPSDIIKPLSLERIDTTNTTLMYDFSQTMGLVAAGIHKNPLKLLKNVVIFGGTHKTFPGPASGLILTNEKSIHEKMETQINPKYLRHSQMHQKISLLFALIEFEKFGYDYMKHMVDCSNYLASKLVEKGFNVIKKGDKYSLTHQIFIKCSKEEMDVIYQNAYKCEVTLNKKHKALFDGYGIRLGTQEIARYNYNEKDLDNIAEIMNLLTQENVDVNLVEKIKKSMSKKIVHFAFDDEIVSRFKNI